MAAQCAHYHANAWQKGRKKMQQAKGGDTVKVQYIGRLDDGKIFDSSEKSGLLEFKIGDEEFIPGLDDAVIGMAPGDSKTVRIPATRAYGPHAEDLVREYDRRCLPSYLVPETGKAILIRQCSGLVQAVVTKVSDSKVILDLNHPLSGKDLTFDLRMMEVN